MGIKGLEICLLIFAAFIKGIEAKYYYYYYYYYTYYYVSPATIGGSVGGAIFCLAILIAVIVSCCRRRANPGTTFVSAPHTGLAVVSNTSHVNQGFSPGYYPGTAPQYAGAAPQYPGAAPQYPGAAPQYPGAAPQYPATAPQPAPAGFNTGAPGVPPPYAAPDDQYNNKY